MKAYEILTLIVATLGALTGIISLLWTRRMGAKQLEYQAIASALAKRQLEAFEKEESSKNKGDVTVELVKIGHTDFRFVFTNLGGAPALNVQFAIAEDSSDNPLIKNECERKLPYPKLEPAQSFTLIAALHMGSALRYATRVSWQNVDGSAGNREIHVAV